MHNFTTRLVIATITFMFGVASTIAYITSHRSGENHGPDGGPALSPHEGQGQEVTAPKTKWEESLFKVIDEQTNKAHLRSLRLIRLNDGDSEVRVWVGFGQNGEDGLVLRRVNNRWSATHLHGIFEVYPPNTYHEELPEPNSGWDLTWQKLARAGLLTLPDAASLQCNSYVNDGTTYVVEVNVDHAYRAYMYDNPDSARCKEAKQMISLGEIIANEFRLEEFRIKR